MNYVNYKNYYLQKFAVKFMYYKVRILLHLNVGFKRGDLY